MSLDSGIYCGNVVHKRVRPKPHALDYRVFSFLLDLDEIAPLAKRLRLFSYNTWNVFSFYDRDHGAGDRKSIIEIARVALDEAGLPSEGRRIFLLSYPRIFGYVFNPLSVFFVYAPAGDLETLIYEVNNTFGERTSYVVSAGARQADGVYVQSCGKDMYVSPFAAGHGRYGFVVKDPDDEVIVGVNFSDGDGPLIKTHFRGQRSELSDASLLKLLVQYPLFTLKVIVAIHYEAAKLWLKGVPLTERHVSPRYAVSHNTQPRVEP
jgi:uncharacterized protein